MTSLSMIRRLLVLWEEGVPEELRPDPPKGYRWTDQGFLERVTVPYAREHTSLDGGWWMHEEAGLLIANTRAVNRITNPCSEIMLSDWQPSVDFSEQMLRDGTIPETPRRDIDWRGEPLRNTARGISSSGLSTRHSDLIEALRRTFDAPIRSLSMGARASDSMTRLSEVMSSPIRQRLNYQSMGRQILAVEPLPDMRLPVYDRDLSVEQSDWSTVQQRITRHTQLARDLAQAEMRIMSGLELHMSGLHTIHDEVVVDMERPLDHSILERLGIPRVEAEANTDGVEDAQVEDSGGSGGAPAANADDGPRAST